MVKISIKTRKIDFNTLRFLIDFCSENLNTSYKVVSSDYIYDNSDPGILKCMPNNLLFFPMYCKIDGYLKGIPLNQTPFISVYYRYFYGDFLRYCYDIFRFEWMNTKKIKIYMLESLYSQKLDSQVYVALRYCKL
ncbi:hypothetical protein LUQ84_001804 [Hamiltosporidium tvaerminnensis]|nr:hypothetical protein LUQ84_001794 [Hamiltosporidium tvaerminnensis]KAK1349123.1 hypothetical protein LUQ84_001804 [Hamiltosporidium tvaerminnensis]